MKCSYILFNKEHVKAILLEASTQKSSGNMQLTQSCMDILVVKFAKCILYLMLLYVPKLAGILFRWVSSCLSVFPYVFYLGNMCRYPFHFTFLDSSGYFESILYN